MKQEEARQEGLSQGKLSEREKMIMNVLMDAGSIGQAASLLRLDEREVRKVAEERKICVSD